MWETTPNQPLFFQLSGTQCGLSSKTTAKILIILNILEANSGGLKTEGGVLDICQR